MMSDSTAPWLDRINGKDAKKLIETNFPVIRVIAGPGSGKTTCLERRTRRLIEKDKVDATKIFVGTFTRTITKEITSNLDSQINISTIHALAYKLLLKYPAARQGMHLRLLLDYETDVMLHDIKNKMPGIDTIYECKKILRKIQSDKAKHEEISNVPFSDAVEHWLRKHRAVLIGDVVHLCVQGLKSKNIESGLFDHVIIDEYQDLTSIEQELVNHIWSKSGALVVMGDNNQSIYSFRYNHPKGIEDFHKAWEQCEDLTFNDNYRNGEPILEIANLMMAKVSSKPMNPMRKNDGDVKIIRWDTIDDEIKGLAAHIRSRKEDSFLVLVPRRFIGYRLADAIGNDAKTIFSEQILEHDIIRESFALASLLADSSDFVAARTYLGYNDTDKHALNYNADIYNKISLEENSHKLISKIANDEISLSGSGKKYIKTQAKKAEELIKSDLPSDEIIDCVFSDTCADKEKDEEKRRRLTSNLQEIRNAACKIYDSQSQPDLSKIISKLRYKIATREPLQESEEARVNIMTLYSAKGLEANHVIIPGMVDQFMSGDVDCEEQRRLLYVAITRARDSLIISCPRLIRFKDVKSSRTDNIITHNGERWVKTGLSSLLPSGMTITNGHDLNWCDM